MSRRDDELKYVRSLANRETKAIGFLPDSVYGPALASGRLLIVRENDEPCGFLLRGPCRATVRIYQTAVDPAARLRNHGRQLFLESLLTSLDADVERIEWICAADLPANEFWHNVTESQITFRPSPKTGRRPRLHYQHVLPRGKELEEYLERQLYNSTAWRIACLSGCPELLERGYKKRFRATR